MTDVRTVVEQYIAVWNETDGDKRRALIADVFTASAGYTDPLGAVSLQLNRTPCELVSPECGPGSGEHRGTVHPLL